MTLAVFCAGVPGASAVPSPVRVSAGSPFAACASAPSFVGAEVEPALAVDPRNSKRLVAVYQQDRYRSAGARGIVVALSEDGGRTWRRAPLPVSRCAGPRARGVRFASDPWVSVGPDGRIYVATLSEVVSVLTSADWGRSWSAPALIRGRGLTDKETLTADPRRAGTAYVVWSDYRRTNPPGTESDELVSVTHDGGRSWSRPTVVFPHGRRAGPEDGQILVDPRSGRLYLLTAWVRNGFATTAEPAWMFVQHSDDGGRRWSKPRRFGAGRPAARRGGPVIRGSPQVPSFGIDARGALYAVWQDGRFSGGARDQVLVTSSRDGGVHWSPGRRLGGPQVGGILPTVAARGDGAVAVLYLELAGGAPISARYRVAISSDSGRRFRDRPVSRSFPLTDAPQLRASPLVPGGYFLGDYMGLAPLGPGTFGALFVVAQRATDNRTDVYYDEVS